MAWQLKIGDLVRDKTKKPQQDLAYVLAIEGNLVRVAMLHNSLEIETTLHDLEQIKATAVTDPRRPLF